MVRVTKEYDQRLVEFLETAQQLFFQKGYEMTSVNDIIEQVGVAKGTFYHYFKSKEDLLDKLVRRFAEQTFHEVKKIVKQKNKNAMEKLREFFITIRNLKLKNIDLMKMLMKVLYNYKNLILRHKMFKAHTRLLVPEFAKIIQQGQQEGVFNPVDASETAEMIFVMSTNLNEIVVGLLLDMENKPENLYLIEKKIKVYEKSMERILGCAEGSLSVADRRIIEFFGESIKQKGHQK